MLQSEASRGAAGVIKKIKYAVGLGSVLVRSEKSSSFPKEATDRSAAQPEAVTEVQSAGRRFTLKRGQQEGRGLGRTGQSGVVHGLCRAGLRVLTVHVLGLLLRGAGR